MTTLYFSFVSSLLTGVLMYHLAWVPTVTPSGETQASYADKHSPKWVCMATVLPSVVNLSSTSHYSA